MAGGDKRALQQRRSELGRAAAAWEAREGSAVFRCYVGEICKI